MISVPLRVWSIRSCLTTSGRTCSRVSSGFQSVYFTRLWIVQEFLLAKKIQILVDGGSWLDFRVVPECVYLSAAAAVAYTGYHDVSPVELLFMYKTFVTKQLEFSLFTCLGEWASNACQDPRDRIFGLMVIVKEKDRIALNYERCAAEFLLDVLSVWFRVELTNWHYRVLLMLASPRGLDSAQQRGWSELVHALNQNEWVKESLSFYDENETKGKVARRGVAIEAVGYETPSSDSVSSISPQLKVPPVDFWWYKRGTEVFIFKREDVTEGNEHLVLTAGEAPDQIQ